MEGVGTMSLYPFADTMTEAVCDRLVRAARIRRPLRQLAWRNAVQDAINIFRPAILAKEDAALCAGSTSSIHAHVEREGGANSASPSGDRVRGNATA